MTEQVVLDHLPTDPCKTCGGPTAFGSGYSDVKWCNGCGWQPGACKCPPVRIKIDAVWNKKAGGFQQT